MQKRWSKPSFLSNPRFEEETFFFRAWKRNLARAGAEPP
jgi:hypothetical protein